MEQYLKQYLKQHKFLYSYSDNRKIVFVPLEFCSLGVDIISKEFTKLNNNHRFRIHYLGPRFKDNKTMHKKLSLNEKDNECLAAPDRKINKYCFDVNKICNSGFINEKLESNHFYKPSIYYRAFEGMNPTLKQSQQYIFNSAFESGNLDCVVKFQQKQFDLFLRVDSNSRGHLQWFYFSISNGKKKQTIKINLCNISKPGTLYEKEMKPYTFSKKIFETTGQGWSQKNQFLTNMVFCEKKFNYHIIEDRVSTKSYCYSYDYEFAYEDDKVFFAYCIPYTYSELLNDLRTLPEELVKVETLGKTLCGLDIPILHITDHSSNFEDKKNVIITGRIHPGQSNGSHVLNGFIKYLCNNEKAIETLKTVNFFIVPMLNPDGVVLGNSRCSAIGRDLNRMFLQNCNQVFPELQALKSFLEKFRKEKQLFMYFDFHGHSRKKNTFFYGPAYQISHPNYLKSRILPKIVEKIDNTFRYYSCNFNISEGKKTTGRALMFESLNIPFTYTVESSIGLFYDSQLMKTFPFNKQRYEKMGASICEGVCIFIPAYNEYENFLRQRRIMREKLRNRTSMGKRLFTRNLSQGQNDQSPEKFSLKSNTQKEKDQQKDCLFVRLLEQIQRLPTNNKDDDHIDSDASSDDHDEKEDLPQNKLKQLNYLIVRNSQQKQYGKVKQTEQLSKNRQKSPKKLKNKQARSVSKNSYFDDQQLSFFNEKNFRQKPQTSQNKRLTNSFQNRESGNYRKTSYNKEDSINWKSPKKFKRTIQFEERPLETNFQFKIQENEKYELKGKNFLRRSIVMRQRSNKSQNQKNSHFSQMQFPQKFEQSSILKHQKTDLLRKSFCRKKEKDHSKWQNESIVLSETNITKQPILNQRSNRSRILSDFGPQSPRKMKDSSPTKISELKIGDLMENLEFHSRLVQESVKFKDKPKPKTALIFPSSFHGIRQQLSMKGRNNSLQMGSLGSERSPFSLTISNFPK